jgi:hypothetical protein
LLPPQAVNPGRPTKPVSTFHRDNTTRAYARSKAQAELLELLGAARKSFLVSYGVKVLTFSYHQQAKTQSYPVENGTTDALAKMLIEKGAITDTNPSISCRDERSVYERILNPTTQ